MINIVEKSKCSGCYACVEVCPRKCIDMVSDAEGFWYPYVDVNKCIKCGVCEQVCPIKESHTKSTQGDPLIAYAAINKNPSVRLKSSSGGIFSALAIYILSNSGVVFGAGFDENFNVVHKYVEHGDDLHELQGSKYVQSRIGNSYHQAEEFLKQGKLVLFSGTPCQIEGLFSYLNKSYDNLITTDLICHGVPSPMVWRKYVEYRRLMANGARPKKISFRAKNYGWKRYSVSFLFENDTEYRQTLDKDPMMQVFLKNLCLRPSCHDCFFKSKVRRSDITLADFWGVNNVIPNIDDNKGVSLVFIQSRKGQELFSRISESVTFVEVDQDTAIVYNTSMIESAAIPQKRNEFLKNISENNFRKIQKKYCRASLKNRMKIFFARCVRKLRKILKRILNK